MTKVFIGGSRRITRLTDAVRRRIDRMMERHLAIVVGDAAGADRAVQQYLSSRGYEAVEVFCSNGECRNNLGKWPTRQVPVPKGKRGFEFYSVKDEQMAREADIGFMLWDGKSKGTLHNILRLLDGQKKVVVYLSTRKVFLTLRSKYDLKPLPFGGCRSTRERGRVARLLDRHESSQTRPGLFQS